MARKLSNKENNSRGILNNSMIHKNHKLFKYSENIESKPFKMNKD